jgi:hypothetical protein
LLDLSPQALVASSLDPIVVHVNLAWS